MNIKKLSKLFKKEGYSIRKDDYESAYYFNTPMLRVGIFGEDYPNTGYNGKIIVDHESNFDKWSKWYYMVDLPKNKEEFDMVISDLNYISNERHEGASNSYGKMMRTFS